MSIGGCPPGDVRKALVEALRSGVSGTFDTLACRVGVDRLEARRTLSNLRRDGVVVALGAEQGERRVGRPRLVYGVACNEPSFDALGHLCRGWR